MINPNLSGTLARAVFSMHDGTVVVNNTSSFWSSYIAIVLNNGKTVYYKHIRPSTTNPVNNTTVNLIVTNQTISKGDFLGLMILPQSNSNEFLHLHINDNDVSGTLQGNTNWLNQFLFPFEDNKKPNIKYISNNSIISNDIDINAIEFRGNGCAYNINPQPEIRNLSYSDLNGNSRRIIFDKLDLIIRTTDPHIQADGSGSTGNNGIDRIKYQLINSSTQIALEDQNINFSDVPNNSIANQIFDYRSSQSAHTYIISNNNINVPYDRFLNTRLTIDGNETYDLLNRNGLDAISNNHTKFSEGYYEVKVIVSDRNDFTNSDPNESIVSVPI